MESNNELESYLAQAGSEGESLGEGDFTLDPRRALEILREQGSIVSHAPLFLLRAIYQHTDGAPVRFTSDLFGTAQLRWPPEFGALPNEAMRVMAEGAFKTNLLALTFKEDRVLVQSRHRLRVEVEPREVFLKAGPRLQYYPMTGLIEQVRRTPWRQHRYEAGVLELFLPDQAGLSTCYVVDGIQFPEPGSLPLGVLVYDDKLKCDLSLTHIPETDRKREWSVRARALLLGFLRDTLLADQPLQLDLDHLSDALQAALGFLPFIQRLSEGDELRQFVEHNVLFRDVFGNYWSIAQIQAMEQKHGSVLVIPAIPRHCPKESTGEQPVLHWRGDTKKYGRLIFHRTRSGAGYLYSMARGEAVDRDGASFLNVQEWAGGSLGLLPLGDPETRCEVQLVGKRRGSETIYLEEPAPSGLRLLWRSRDELASWDPTPEFLFQVALVVDGALPELEVEETWIRDFLLWTGINDLKETFRLASTAFLERVDGEHVSPKTVRKVFGEEPVSVLEERSASLPDELPFEMLLWDHPLLGQLGFETREESSTVRKTYWREDGRKRWLARYAPTTPQAWAEKEGLELESIGVHYLASLGPDRATRLIVWREGRPLGQTVLSEAQFPKGYALIVVDDEFPGDQYWSGPDRDALSQLGPLLDDLKSRMEA